MLVAYLHRLSKGDTNLNDGFSVVAPISSKGQLVFVKTIRESKTYLNVALLDVRQKYVLLRLVESVYLIKEEYSFSAGQMLPEHTTSDVQVCTYLPVSMRVFFASSKTARTSFMPASVALSSRNIEPVCLAISRASVVFPHLQGYVVRTYALIHQ